MVNIGVAFPIVIPFLMSILILVRDWLRNGCVTQFWSMRCERNLLVWVRVHILGIMSFLWRESQEEMVSLLPLDTAAILLLEGENLIKMAEK